ncbi:hypothetical protein V7O67_13220 [Methanolobus sp. ZRKC4]|uniref:hypothetical protein n=1 Tax=Methanolobus sp. ZRKC4 TaxID=3125787 RepID=UPI00324AB0EB
MELTVGVIEAGVAILTIVAGLILFIVQYESRLSKMETKLEPVLQLEPRLISVEQEVKSLDIMKNIISEVGSERVQKVFKEKKE